MLDAHFLRESLTLAKIQSGFCAPNPSVGAVILNPQKQIIATGYHKGCGLPHAEVAALKKIKDDIPHTLYVTLEPCCHFGKTPPCTDAIIQANIQRVVYGYADPNPKVNGQGKNILEKAGIICEHMPLPEIDAFYKSYHHWQKTKTPFVTAKIAMSMNGKIAKKNGEPIQITGRELQQKTHEHRKTSDAILTTAETILHDDPQLNVRINETTYAKPIYILDSHLRIPKNAQIFKTAKSVTIFYASKNNVMPACFPAKNSSLRVACSLCDVAIQEGFWIATSQKEHATSNDETQCMDLPDTTGKHADMINIRYIPIPTIPEGLDLNAVIQQIGQDGVHDLWVEAGGKCFSSLIRHKLVNKAFIYMAPIWINNGKTAFDELKLDAKMLQWQPIGQDVFCEIDW